MKRNIKLSIAISATFALLASQASAQTISETTANGAADDIVNFSMTVQTGVTLTIQGTADGGDTTTLTSTAGNEGTIAFGNINSVTGTPTTGGRFRVTSGNTGSMFVGSLQASVTVGGGTDVSLGIEREAAAGGPTDIPLAQLRYATGLATDWTASETAGTQVPDLGAGVGTELGAAIANGSNTDFQVGVYIRDSTAAGAYSTAVVLTATPN